MPDYKYCICDHSTFFHKKESGKCDILSCGCSTFVLKKGKIGFKKEYSGPLDALINEMGKSFGLTISKSEDTENKFSTRLWTKTFSPTIKADTLEESLEKAIVFFRKNQ